MVTVDMSLELDHNFRDKIRKWNCMVQNWLEKYVYYRIYDEQEMRKNRRKADFANNVTFIVSAIWHGFYPGYLLAFFHWSLFTMVAKKAYYASKKFPNHAYDHLVYRLVRLIFNTYILNYFGVFFTLLSFDLILIYMKNTYYLGPILIYGSLLFFFVTKIHKDKKTEKKE